MNVEHQIWNGIPLLYVKNDQLTNESPLVFFLHGHMSAKEHNLHYAYQLVKKGVRVILPDAMYHGDRFSDESDEILNMKFWDIVLNSIQEVPLLVEEARKRGLVTTNKIGLAGTSMGGVTTSACLTIYDWIDSAAIMMGTTSLTKLATYQLQTIRINGKPLPFTEEQKQYVYQMLSKFDLENKKEVLYEKPVIFWHGEQDKIVPFKETYDFYENELTDSKAVFIKDKIAAHNVSRKGILEVTTFLAQHLS